MPRLLAREHRSGAAEAGHDLVGDQEHVVARAELARAARGSAGSCIAMPAAPCTSGSTMSAAIVA